MWKKYRFNLSLAVMLGLSLLTGCSGSGDIDRAKEANASDPAHPVITMNAPYRNMSAFVDLVHEKYPEIQLEVIPYNGQNTSAYMKDMRLSGQMADIYFTSYYTPGRYSDETDFLDLSTYDFTENFTQSRLREVTWNGGIYMLPLSYNALGITYNKTLLEKNGWTLPTNLDELEALKGEAEEAGCVFSRCQLQYPGYGFQFLCDIADTGFLSTMEGITWQEQFLKGEANASDTPALVQTLQILNRWRDMGMLNGDGTPTDDTATKKFVSEGNTLFLVGNSNDLLDKTDTSDTYRLMPFLSEDGSQNVFVLVVSRYVGLNKKLGEAENQAKLQDALHIMELLSTEEGIQALEPSQSNSRLLPLKNWTPGPDSYYVDMLDDLNSGHTANNVYSGWENIVVPVGETMIDFICGRAELDDVIQCFDENQYRITENETPAYTRVTETLGTEDCAKLVGISFGKATGADAALISVNEWKYNRDSKCMNDKGVSGSLFPLEVSDEELVSILPTGWRGNIETVTLTGARIRELAETGYDGYGNGDTFPYVLVLREGVELEDTAFYTIPICGVTDEVAEEGGLTDSGILGLDAAREYFSQFETLSKKDIRWE